MSGIALGESPRWRNGRLLFADWGAHEVIAVDDDGASEVVASVESFPLSIDSTPDGDLLLVDSERRRLLLRRGSDGELTQYADLSTVATDDWNDVVVDGRGNTYVGSIGSMSGERPEGDLIALVTPDGSARRVADGLSFPNGMAVTPDNSTLIVAESNGHRLTAFDIAPDGDLSGRRVWADLGDCAPDGICLDADGAVWYADVPHQHCVRVAEGGAVLATVEVDRACFACALGGPDGSSLYVLAARWPDAMEGGGERTGQVLVAPAPAAGVGWP
jgi:sugar lactone lactonase YvrE